jgi:hypothetical protein
MKWMIPLFIALFFFHAEAGTAKTVEHKDISQIITDEFQLPKMKVEINLQQIKRQERFKAKISFLEALRAAMTSFLKDSKDLESPLSLVMQGQYGASAMDVAKPQEVLRNFLNRPNTTLTLLATKERPEGGESVRKNWIFHLYIEDLSDHSHWAIIARRGKKPVYNYGFN